MFSFSFREMVKWYDDLKDNIDLFENDSQCIAIFIKKEKGAFVKQNIDQDDIRRVKFIEK
jgi:hypothetical protein